MTQRIPIPKIFAMYIDKNMETRGYTTRIHQSNNIEVQEVSRSLTFLKEQPPNFKTT